MKQIRKSDIDFDTFWAIYCQAFPANERREMAGQQKVMEHERYAVTLLEHDGNTVGFITYWDLGSFIFGEHFAVHPDYRGGGIGERCLGRFLSTLSKPFVIEVELAMDEISTRRIAFYQRLGIKLNGYDYLQPPYGAGKKPVPMKLMSFPNLLSQEDFEKARMIIYRIVYSYPP